MRSFANPLGRLGQVQPRTSVVQQAGAAQRGGDWAEAVRLYEIEIARSPDRADLLIQLGHCNKERGEYRLSYDSYRRALDLQPTNDDAYLHLGHLLKVCGNIFCAARCYRVAAHLGNSDGRLEFAAIPTIAAPPRFTLRRKGLPATVILTGGPFEDNQRRLQAMLGALEMCEVDPAHTDRLRHAALLLFAEGFLAAAKGIFEMSFIREGFGATGRRNSIEIALLTGLWSAGGPLVQSSDIARRPFPTTSNAAIGWLAEEFGGDNGTAPPRAEADRMFAPPAAAADPISAASAASAGSGPLAAHGVFSPGQIPAIRDLVSRLYQALAAVSADDDWAELRAVMDRLKTTVAEAAPLVSFDEGQLRNDVETHAARVLFNNLYDFVAENFALTVGALASPHGLARAARFDCPLLAPYLGRASGLFAAPQQVADNIVQEIARGRQAVIDHARSSALEQAVAVIGCRLQGEPLLNVFAAAAGSNLPDAMQALLFSCRDDWSLTFQFAKILKQNGHFALAREMLRRIPCPGPIADPGSFELGVLLERGILAKICGDFDEAVQIFSKCLACDRGNNSLKEELLTLLPETDSIQRVAERVNSDPEFRELAQRRRLYRLHTEGWICDAQNGWEASTAIDNWVLEIATEGAANFANHRVAAGERIELVHLGWERRQSRWGNLHVLRGIEAVRARVISSRELLGLRVRIDGRTVCYEPAQTPIRQGADTREYVFNAWLDVSVLRPGPHELQLYFEERIGGHRSRDELVFVDRPLTLDDRTRTSGSVVVLDDATAALPLEERVNSLPSVIHSTKRQFLDRPIRRILVVRADQLGDFVLSVPAIRRLRQLFPAARFDALVGPSVVEIARETGFFEELIEVTMSYEPLRGRRYLAPLELIELRRKMAYQDFDLAIDLSTGGDTRPLLRLSGAPITVGFKPQQFPWLSFGIDAAARDPVNGRERVAHGTLIMMLVEGLATLLNSDWNRALTQHSNLDRSLVERFGIGAGEDYVLLHVGARLHMKQWPLAHYRELARLVIDATALKVVMLLDNPAQLEEIKAADLPADRLCAVTGLLPFEELDALVAHCLVMVGNDSGPKHLAAARGTKVVSVHMGQVNWQEWGQEGDGLIVTRHVPCYGCGIVESHECGKDLACLVHIRPKEVFTAVQRALAARTGSITDANGIERRPSSVAQEVSSHSL